MANEDRIIAVYMMANRKQGALYAGVACHLVQRVWQHREGIFGGFTQKHGCKMLVWYELHDEISTAIAREKSLKSYRRKNKINLITERNPRWKDLWFEITGQGLSSPASPAHAGVSSGWLRLASAGDPGMRRGYGLWDRDHSPPMTPAQAGVHLGTSTHAHEAASGDGYLPTQVSSELGFCAPYPSENSLPHTKHLLSREPDQVPFWLWVAGSGWCGSEIRSDARLGRSGQGEPRKLGWESASSGRTGIEPPRMGHACESTVDPFARHR
ncbi:GIY-YIG nuclease family protein [uncultured Hyphomonas sp.]|uniref:GIY-YIG nuclease family protein n=1 Tax=uncultured Hyphomonas sp. TaxID=225298 RepID=UPI0030DB5354